MLLRLGVSVLFGHAKIDDMYYVGSLGAWATDQEIVRLDISVDEVLLVDCLHPGKLRYSLVGEGQGEDDRAGLTICFATITTVLIVNRRLQ